MVGYLKVFAYLCAGEIIIRLTGWPIPGPMVGLVLMLCDFSFNGRADREVEQIFDGVSKHLAILFVPAGAGVIAYGAILNNGLPLILIAIIIGTTVTMVITAFLFQLIHRSDKKK
jgi:holin-like protein